MSEKVIEKFIKKHGDRYIYNLVDYKNAITKVSIICKKHGLFKITPNSHLNGSGCYECGREKVNISRLTSNEDFINKCRIIHNDIYDYSKVDYKGVKEYIIINCKKHGDFKQKATKHLQGQGCKKCSNEKMFVDFKKMCFEKYPEYGYDKMIYNGMYKKVIITCNEHGDFEKTPIDFYHKDRICPKCVNRCKSNNETKWLDELNVPTDKRNIYIKFGNKTFCVDGVDHDNKIIYEFYGDFFHGNPDVHNKDDINPLLKETYGSLYNKTINKEKIILNSGYKLKTIWESEYKKIINMKKFWEQKEWLDKTKEDNVDFYKKVINGQNIEMDFSTFQLIIDGVGHDLKLSGDDSETKTKIEIINEDGSKNTFIR